MKNNKQLFLVDDDPLFLKLLETEFLLNTDYKVKTFASGELCIAGLLTHPDPDAIILDYNLSSVDKNAINGLQTLDRIKAYNPNTPVVILSSDDVIGMEKNCLHYRAFDYVVKGESSFEALQQALGSIFADT